MRTPEQTRMTRQHIFAVNGSSEFLDVVRDLFEDEQYNITTTNFVPETYDQIVALDPSVLIIDVAAGDRAGRDLLERLGFEAATRGLPVIVVSTSPRLLDEVEADPDRFHGQRFLQKPFDLDDLLHMVNDLIGPA